MASYFKTVPRALFALAVVLWLIAPSKPPAPAVDAGFGRVSNTSNSSRFAVATFLTGGGGDDFLGSDGYFVSTRMLAYQLLHNPATRCDEAVDFVVLVARDVPEPARQRLRADGAVVAEAEPVPLPWWVRTGVTRWKDQFLKLRLFEMTQYARVLFIDADSLVRAKVDAIFAEPEVRTGAPTLPARHKRADEAPLPAQFVFGARSDNHLTGARDHPFPPLNTNVFSAGFWVAAPSAELFAYFASVLGHYRRFDPHTMEQSLLNYAFRRDGPMPWRELHYGWSATWPNSRDVEGGVATLHDKFWLTGPQELRDLWRHQRRVMEDFFQRRDDESH